MLISHMQNVVRLTHDTQSLKTKQMVKSTLKLQMNSNQNNRPANLSAHVNKTCIELALGTLPCFTRLFESTINITVGRQKRQVDRTTKKLLTLSNFVLIT